MFGSQFFFACITSLITWGGRSGVCFPLPEPQLQLCGVSRVKDMSFTEEHSAAWNGSWNGAGTQIFVQFWFSIKLLFPLVSISCLKWKWLFHTSLVRVVGCGGHTDYRVPKYYDRSCLPKPAAGFDSPHCFRFCNYGLKLSRAFCHSQKLWL